MPVSVIFENLEAGANIDAIMIGSKVWIGTRLGPLSNLLPAVSTRPLRLPLAVMLVLFDQGTPVPIRPFLKQHTVQTTA
jgi:hypothetical protein